MSPGTLKSRVTAQSDLLFNAAATIAASVVGAVIGGVLVISFNFLIEHLKFSASIRQDLFKKDLHSTEAQRAAANAARSLFDSSVTIVAMDKGRLSQPDIIDKIIEQLVSIALANADVIFRVVTAHNEQIVGSMVFQHISSVQAILCEEGSDEFKVKQIETLAKTSCSRLDNIPDQIPQPTFLSFLRGRS